MYLGYMDSTYLLVILGTMLCLFASALVNSSMNKYSKVTNSMRITGADAARRILDQEGLSYVRVECLSGNQGDHYDPSSETVRLSAQNYRSASVTALSVAAHECGHAIQHAQGYAMVNIRSALVPVVNISSRLGWPLILVGVLLSWNPVLIEIGIWAFMVAVLFHLVTLPVEINASRRAIGKLRDYGFATSTELSGCKKVLTAAALTYVAAAAASFLQLLRLVILFGGGRNKRRD